MDEIGVDHRQIVAMIHGVEQLLAHAHQRGGAAGREIEPAEQLEPPRFGDAMQLGCVRGRRRFAPRCDSGVDPRPIMAENARQRLEEGDTRADGQLRILGKDLVCQRHAGRLAATREQILAKLDETGRAGARRLAPVAPDQGAAAVGDALQHLAEERSIHRIFHQPGEKLASDRRRQ